MVIGDFIVPVVTKTFGVLLEKCIDKVKTIYKGENKKNERKFLIPENLGQEEKIRMSFAYLIRIKIDDKYLLVKGKLGRFQPVGGVYHYYDKYLNQEFDFENDEYHADKDDIRGCILLRQVDEFVSWFEKGKNRECNPIREFNEELLETKILDSEFFKYPEFRLIKSEYRGIKFDKFASKQQLMRFDIYELRLNEKQIKALKMLDNEKENEIYRFFKKSEIEKFGITEINNISIIANHTHYILN